MKFIERFFEYKKQKRECKEFTKGYNFSEDKNKIKIENLIKRHKKTLENTSEEIKAEYETKIEFLEKEINRYKKARVQTQKEYNNIVDMSICLRSKLEEYKEKIFALNKIIKKEIAEIEVTEYELNNFEKKNIKHII